MGNTFRIVIEPDEPGYHAYCPALPGLHVPGDTPEEALRNAAEAAVAYLDSMLEHGERLPGFSARRPERFT